MTEVSSLPRRYCSVCATVVSRKFKPGPGGRPNASCPRCRSLERHRFLVVLLSALELSISDLGVLLDVAPSVEISPFLAALEPRVHLRLDLGADPRMVDVYGSLTELPLPDESVDLVVCYHVLEHIPDDRAAMRELARVLSRTGVGLLQVPFRSGTQTDEDPSAPVEERVRRFGQADHVRYYGDDFEDRLTGSGLSLRRVTPRSLLGQEMSTWLHVDPDEPVWIVRAADGPLMPVHSEAEPTALTRALSALLGESVRLQSRVVEQRHELRQLRTQVQSLKAAMDQPLGVKASARAGVSAVRRRAARALGRS